MEENKINLPAFVEPVQEEKTEEPKKEKTSSKDSEYKQYADFIINFFESAKKSINDDPDLKLQPVFKTEFKKSFVDCCKKYDANFLKDKPELILLVCTGGLIIDSGLHTKIKVNQSIFDKMFNFFKGFGKKKK